MGQYGLLPYPDPGRGHAARTTTSRWLLETFTDSDWSGAKGHRRSTSAAVYMLNVVLTSSRGQKSVSLSSAEAELNALVSGAADGIYLRRRLEFLMRRTSRTTIWLTIQQRSICATGKVLESFDTLQESCFGSRIWWLREILKSKLWARWPMWQTWGPNPCPRRE